MQKREECCEELFPNLQEVLPSKHLSPIISKDTSSKSIDDDKDSDKSWFMDSEVDRVLSMNF